MPQNVMTEARFRALYARCCNADSSSDHPENTGNPESADSLSLYAELLRLYSEPHRHYHTCNHISRCLQQFDLAREQMQSPDAVELALWFHDAIYELGAKDNEQQSADLFIARMGERVDALLTQKVVAMILFTTHQELPQTPDEQFVVDIDLHSFGQPWPDCLQDTKAIRAESPDLAESEYLFQQAKFLQLLLDRPHLYSSQFFRQRYESNAQTNLRRLIEIEGFDE